MPVDETFMTPFSGRKKSCCHFNNNLDYNLNYNALLFFMNTFIQGFENFPLKCLGFIKEYKFATHQTVRLSTTVVPQIIPYKI